MVLTKEELTTVSNTLRHAGDGRSIEFNRTQHMHHATTARELFSLSRRFRNALKQHEK
jgi:hypothetical protein